MEPASKPGSRVLLDSAREPVSQLEAGNISSADTLNSVFRGFHTIKGGGSFLSLDAPGLMKAHVRLM